MCDWRAATEPRPSRASLTPRERDPRTSLGAIANAIVWGRGTASFISGGTLRILTADHMDTCRGHGRSAVIERAYTCAVGSTITVVAHSFVQVLPRVAHT